MFFQTVNLGEMVMCLEDLINYFAQPEELMGMIKIRSKAKCCLAKPKQISTLITHRTRGETESLSSTAKPSGSLPRGRRPQSDPGCYRQNQHYYVGWLSGQFIGWR